MLQACHKDLDYDMVILDTSCSLKHTPLTNYKHKQLTNLNQHQCYIRQKIGIILGMGSANERRRYYVTPSLIGRAHTKNNP